MIEICSLFNFFDNYNNPTPIKSFHLAEGPGGFIEAFVYIRNNPNDTYYGMTLISDNMNIPSWKKSKLFLQKNKNVVIESGITNTGDLMSKKNLLYCLDKYNNSMNVVSGDGGFDFSVDFNNQEQICTNLIFAQICFAIAIQKQGGSFVLKVFDIFTQASIDLLYILSNCYEKVYIIKPNTSRVANSEKYIICKNFVLENSKPFVLRLSKIYDVMDCEKTMENEIRRFLNINISHYYINKLEEINAIFGQQQIENINATFNLIGNTKNDKIELYKKNNISKCTHWCQKYNIPYNKTITAPNIFMSSRDSSHDSSHDSFSDDTDEPILQSNLTKNETYTNSK
jgi:23S rRNA U2552 (ribose-2'-O)-methylase RlmE/FtsJ